MTLKELSSVFRLCNGRILRLMDKYVSNHRKHQNLANSLKLWSPLTAILKVSDCDCGRLTGRGFRLAVCRISCVDGSNMIRKRGTEAVVKRFVYEMINFGITASVRSALLDRDTTRSFSARPVGLSKGFRI